jgi:probable rRNA maturation factor
VRSPEITITVADSAWRQHPRIQTAIRSAARLALRRANAPPGNGLTILLTSDAAILQLNSRYRRKNNPTNVLSFAAANPPGYLGDIAIAYGITAEEADQAGKSLPQHAVHLAVHGVLHLLGYDHEAARDAAKMEALEIDILAQLGIRNPYEIRRRA